MSSQHLRLHRPVHVFTALTLAAALAWPAVSAAAPKAPAFAELLLNTTVHHTGVEPEPGAVAAVRFRIEIPEAGLLALNLTVAGGTPLEPVLRLLDLPAATGGRANGAPQRLAQTPAALLVEARDKGTLFVEVAALEPDQSLPAFKLRSAFQPADPEVDGHLIAADVDPWEDDLGGKKPPGANSGDVLCELGEQDDHGDVPLCATPLSSGQPAAGVLHNDAGDDEDLFRFRLAETAVIAVEAASDSPLQLVLRDGDGLAVAAARSKSGSARLHLARALAAGRYFLEVESLNGFGAEYVLTLHRPSRR